MITPSPHPHTHLPTSSVRFNQHGSFGPIASNHDGDKKWFLVFGVHMAFGLSGNQGDPNGIQGSLYTDCPIILIVGWLQGPATHKGLESCFHFISQQLCHHDVPYYCLFSPTQNS